MIKLAASTIVLSLAATSVFALEPAASTAGANSSIGAGSAGAGAGVGAGTTVGAVVSSAALLVPATALLATVAVIASDDGDQASEDVGKIQKKRSVKKQKKVAGASTNIIKGKAGTPATSSVKGVLPVISDGSGEQRINTMEVGVIPPVISEGGFVTSGATSDRNLVPSRSDNSGVNETVIEKIMNMMTASGTATTLSGLTTSSTAGTY